MLKILVTAGNTWTMLDKVRCITNIFSGRTGATIAVEAYRRGHAVTLVTSKPEVLQDLAGPEINRNPARWNLIDYRTFEDLHAVLERQVRVGEYEALVHSAAVSDYQGGGIYAPATGSSFHVKSKTWSGPGISPPQMVDRAAGKVKSDQDELWIRLVRTPKLVDLFRDPWGFRGVLVKFKLEVGRTDEELVAIAERSRQHSNADLMLANTLEGAGEWAFLGSAQGYEKIPRGDLPVRVIDAVEKYCREKAHG